MFAIYAYDKKIIPRPILFWFLVLPLFCNSMTSFYILLICGFLIFSFSLVSAILCDFVLDASSKQCGAIVFSVYSDILFSMFIYCEYFYIWTYFCDLISDLCFPSFINFWID